MLEQMIKKFDLKFVNRTKWNSIYYAENYVFIWNHASKEWKIKPR